jgi:hypothetical protein
MSSSEILAPRTFIAAILTDTGHTLPAYRIIELRDATDMAAILAVCLCT